MFTLKLIFQNILRARFALLLIMLFSLILLIYCCNPFVINPAEFILYTRYFVPIGILTWFIFGLNVHLLIINSLPIEWLSINKLIFRPERKLLKFLGLIFILFILFQIFMAFIISIISLFTFNSGLGLFKLNFKLYMIYFALPFTYSWIASLCLIIIYKYYSLKRSLMFLSIFVLWIATTLYLEHNQIYPNVFINNNFPFIDPIFSLTFIKENVVAKIIYLISLLTIFFIIVLVRRELFGYLISITYLVLLTIAINNYSEDVSKKVNDVTFNNDFKLYETVKNKNDNSLITGNDKWRITEVNVEPESEYPIKIILTLDHPYDFLSFTLNEQFKISKILSKDNELVFKQQDNIVEVETKGQDYIELYYESTYGTTFYPLMSNVIILPFESNWYPIANDYNHFMVDSLGYIYANVDKKDCENVEMVIGQSNYKWKGDKLDCLSIIKGAFDYIELENTKLLVYQPFITTRQNYIDLLNNLELINIELCDLIYNIDYCTSEIQSISIIPKSMQTNSITLFDSTFTKGNYTFYVNPFLDVNYRPLNEHIKELATFLIPYRLVEDEELSFYLSQYLTEVLEVDTLNYLDFMIEDSSIDKVKWNNYLLLSTIEKRKVLNKMIQEVRGQ